MEKPIIYSGFHQEENEFSSSTPRKHRPNRTSFCTSLESRGYGTMNSRLIGGTYQTPNRTRKIDRKDVRSRRLALKESDIPYKSESSDEALIVPPCSINRSSDDELESISDYDSNLYDEVFKDTSVARHDFQCNVCHKTFYTHLEYHTHQEKHLLPIREPIVKPRCDTCGRKFRNKTNLKRHQDQIHPSEMVVLMVL